MTHRVARRIAGIGLAILAAWPLACRAAAPEVESLASLTVGVAAPVIQQSGSPVGISYHRDALSRETLVALGIDGRPSPRVLDSWETSGDGLTWRLKIRPGIRFHDLTPLTAQELVPQLRSGLMAAALGKVESIEPEGEHAILIRLRERFSFLPEDLGQATAVHVVQERDDRGKVISRKTYGTGPYVVAEESAERIDLREFPNHYRGDPGVAQIAVRLFPDQRKAWSALMRDEIDVLYEVSRESLDFVRSESTVNVATFPRPFVYVLGFNSSLPALRDPVVRRAINHAIDRQALVDTALSNEGEAAADHVWPLHWAHDTSVRAPEYNPAEAIRLMEQAGLSVRADGGGMPARLRLRCAVYEPFRKMALVLQRQLAQVDVDLQLESFGLVDLAKTVGSGKFETFVFEVTSGRTLLWSYLFWHSSSPFLKHGYAAADDALDRMRVAVTDDELRAATAAFQQRLIDDPPAAFLAWGRVSRAVTRRFELPEPGIDIYQTIAKWKPAPSRRPN